ncbi:baseplate J/gp47 family protein [Streptomyces sp. NPDC000410]|uniref:baseplate J/gp47 family protein n=1 Tax=Streptomyces sp. NPDC000410 TaxID=3154254 RepID=UPI00331F87EE
MPLLPPALDTRRWPDLVAEVRSLIPLVSPRWTDHNISDPGIALLELLAWQVDADMYRAGRVTDAQLRKLLALIGQAPQGPRPGTAVLAVSPGPVVAGGTPLFAELPAGVVLTSDGPRTPRLTTLHPVRPTGAALLTAGVDHGTAETSGYTAGWTDRTAALAARVPYPVLGASPRPGAALVLGLDRELPAGTSLSLYLDLDGGGRRPGPGSAVTDPGPDHHDAVTVWEVRRATGWEPLAAAEVSDGTRALTRGGGVRLHLAQALVSQAPVNLPEGAWLRCRLDRGSPDAAHRLTGITVDAVLAEPVEAAIGSFSVAADAVLTGGPVPAPPATVVLALAVDRHGKVTALRAGTADGAEAADGPVVRVLAWQAPQGRLEGRLVAEAVVAGVGDGTPEQRFTLPVEGHVLADRTEVWLCSPAPTARRVSLVADLDASGRADRHAVLDPSTGVLAFGDGRRGAVPELGETVLVACATTGAATAGDAGPRPGARWTLDPGPRNRALLGRDPGPDDPTACSALAPDGGACPEDLAAAAARAERAVWVHERLCEALAETGASSLDEFDRNVVLGLDVPERAVTLADFERCALATPGTWIARARAFAEMDPRLPGLRAAGCVTVVVVPRLPPQRPEPTPGLLDAVRRWLDAHRIIGTRVFVIGPRYLRVSATVSAVLRPDTDRAAALRSVHAALDRFLHPVTGGPRGTGWPFGRDVHRSEVMQVLDEVPSVDHIVGLSFAADQDAQAEGGHSGVLVPADTLVVPGQHDVTAVAGGGS